ncbi:protein PHLOEM PROTEIN 2-LIKE A9-like [Mangifera indica]|uniref:protein PHLOEM PROTEIN 2-LIKE A9-like n=1 Tax=Mangifera indica TaxID=29780 RepID=UPI001CFC0523|nr:protein PHLOEM PROTEIN 2-LIKE A9-like [Mangifera indica]
MSEGNVQEVKPQGLNIVWGDDRRYWQRSDEKAELLQVCWLEVTGSEKVTPGNRYKISFEVSLENNAFGWSGCPVSVMAKIGKKGRYSWKRVKPLDQFSAATGHFLIPDDEFVMQVPPNGNVAQEELYFGLYEIWSGKWKGGLTIHKVIITQVQ